METKIYIDLIQNIKSLDSKKFIQWYTNTIQYGSDLIEENKIVHQIVKSSTTDKYFKLFKYFESYEPEKTDSSNDLLSIIIEDLDYFVKKCKDDLVEKISKDAKLFEISFDIKPAITTNELRESFRFVAKQISSHTYNTQAYIQGTNELKDYIETKYKFVICEPIQIDNFNDILIQGKVFTVKANEPDKDGEKYFYGMEFDNVGMINFNFYNADIEITQYIG